MHIHTHIYQVIPDGSCMTYAGRATIKSVHIYSTHIYKHTRTYQVVPDVSHMTYVGHATHIYITYIYTQIHVPGGTRCVAHDLRGACYDQERPLCLSGYTA